MSHKPVEPQELLENLLSVFNMSVRGNQQCSWDVSPAAGNAAVEAANLLMRYSAPDAELYGILKEGLEKVFRTAVDGNQSADWKTSAACGRTAAIAVRALIALENSDVKPS